MLKDVVGSFELRMLYEIKEYVHEDPGYYGTISAIINEVEKPKRYKVHVEFYNDLFEHIKFNDVTKTWVRDNYLYLDRNNKTIGYNLDKVVAYSIAEYKEDTV